MDEPGTASAFYQNGAVPKFEWRFVSHVVARVVYSSLCAVPAPPLLLA